MSIYCTLLMIEQEDSLRAPIIYQGSHILPSNADARGGNVDLAEIPDHITRSGRDHGRSKKPWLRLGVNDSTVVLTLRQAERLHARIGDWIYSQQKRTRTAKNIKGN